MKIIKNFNNYMKNKLNEFNTNSTTPMICPYCDGSGYVKNKSNNKETKKCPTCKGEGQLYNKKEKK